MGRKVFEDVKFGYQLPPHTPDLIFDIAGYVEEKGFDSVFMADHLVGIAVRRFDFLDAWNILSALAIKTKRVKLGSCVTDPHRKHPAVLAQTVTTLDHLSNGRAILGIGAGEAMNLDPYGIIWDRPVSRMHEAVKAVKECWTQPVANFEGKFYHIKNALVDPKPIQKPHPPIWIAGNSPRTMKITAEIADGWIPMAPPLTPNMYKKNFENILEQARKNGRETASIEPALFTYVVVAEDHDTAKEIIELPARMTIATLSKFAPHLQLKGSIPEEFQLHRLISNQENIARLLEHTMDVVPPEAIDDFFVYGSPEDCIDGIEKYLKAGVKHLIVAMFVRLKTMKETLQLYAEKVVPYFMEQK